MASNSINSTTQNLHAEGMNDEDWSNLFCARDEDEEEYIPADESSDSDSDSANARPPGCSRHSTVLSPKPEPSSSPAPRMPETLGLLLCHMSLVLGTLAPCVNGGK